MPTITSLNNLTYDEALPRVIKVIKKKCEVVDVTPEDRLLEDLEMDCLLATEVFMALEEEFDVTLPDEGAAFFAAEETWCVGHLVALVVQCRDLEKKRHPAFARPTIPAHETVPFTQRGGSLGEFPDPLYLSKGINREGFQLYERQTDGIPVVQLPNGFLMDREPVSNLAYSRFLNSTSPDKDTLDAWCGAKSTYRGPFFGVVQSSGAWKPLEGLEQIPVVLVSWYGAHAYALWAHGENWQAWESADTSCYLPTSTDWEYAAQGVDLNTAVVGQHVPGNAYMPTGLPLFATNARLAVSQFGLHHMAGNIWHWCADFYEDSTQVRNERGGSWIGPIELASPTYKRGRHPHLRGRCLGFRCGHTKI
jgi:formylglycine-generating enzyme